MSFGQREASISQESIFEIFSWLPSKSLMRFKCVSRLSNSIVSESDFVDIHFTVMLQLSGHPRIREKNGSKNFVRDGSLISGIT